MLQYFLNIFRNFSYKLKIFGRI